ncbi:hypothetical protein V496_09103 [Pseudogymnoascus sp. VKM F-4515 (FW-2607)]|nr:hypothetical protein V496_09103 [Pseudogymnoascus sp. VKM F-4515 (FW-2607)]KFY98690.1 hypothetical protein V498_01298 [Pseudogymnoascus sp. VKM F-4517 (FW-2822)]
MLPDIETTRIVPMTYDDADGPPADSKKRQICGVKWDQSYSIEYITRGESINVWFKGDVNTGLFGAVARVGSRLLVQEQNPDIKGILLEKEQGLDVGAGVPGLDVTNGCE